MSVCPSVNFNIIDFFFRTTGPILTKLGTNHPLGEKGFKFLQRKGIHSPSPRGDNSKRVEIH
jgi:hypothetical protein